MKLIKLTRGKYAKVDDEDFEYLNQWKWCLGQIKYASRRDKNKTIAMHRFIMNPSENLQIDHIDRNTLNNQKHNLRLCTHTENQRNCGKQENNTSGYKGVSKHGKKYAAQIEINKKHIHLGYWNTAEEAARAYDKASKKLHGKFANTNFQTIGEL